MANELADLANSRNRAVLSAGLKDSAPAAHGLDDAPALVNVERNGLFAIDIFARFDGIDAHEGMPVIGRGDHDGVDVIARQQFPVIIVSGASLAPPVAAVNGVHLPLALLAARPIDVANREKLHRRVVHEPAQMPAAHRAPADQPHLDARHWAARHEPNEE